MFLTEREIEHSKIDAVEHTHCPFASRSNIIESSSPIIDELNDSCLMEIKREFEKLIQSSSFNDIDGFKIDIYKEIDRISQLVLIVNRLLLTINPLIKQQDVTRDGWRFIVSGSPFFIVVMSSIYPDTHCRHIPYGSTILFQPEHSFHRFIPRDRRRQIAQSIRKVFLKQGIDYVRLVETASEPQKYILPIDINDGFISWWD